MQYLGKGWGWGGIGWEGAGGEMLVCLSSTFDLIFIKTHLLDPSKAKHKLSANRSLVIEILMFLWQPSGV